MKAILRQIINRDCHVGMSHRAVIRHVITSGLRRGYETFRSMSKDERQELLCHCVAIQRENRALYDYVMHPRSREE